MAGIFFVVLSVILIFFIATKFGNMDTAKFIRYLLFSLVSMGLGFFFIKQSLKSQEKDKREELINEKADKASMRIIHCLYLLR